MKKSRQGAALVIALCILMVLAAFGAVVRLLSHGAYRELDTVNSHLRAIAVGEICFSRLLGRLSATGWTGRWFRTGPDIQFDVAAAGGTFSYILRDAPTPAPLAGTSQWGGPASLKQADLLVRATWRRSSVVLFWRLSMPEGSLDGLARVVPTYFMFGPESSQPAPADVDPLSAEVNRRVRERIENLPGAIEQRGALSGVTSAPAIARLLGVPPGPIIDELPPPSGQGPSQPQPPVVTESTAGESTILPPPPLPPPGPATAPPAGSEIGLIAKLLNAIVRGAQSQDPGLLNTRPSALNAYRKLVEAQALGQPISGSSPDPQMQQAYADANNYINSVRMIMGDDDEEEDDD